MTKFKKYGMQWHVKARRIETAIEAPSFARRCRLTKEEAVVILRAAAPIRKEPNHAPSQ
jgi:hypothetical protein